MSHFHKTFFLLLTLTLAATAGIGAAIYEAFLETMPEEPTQAIALAFVPAFVILVAACPGLYKGWVKQENSVYREVIFHRWLSLAFVVGLHLSIFTFKLPGHLGVNFPLIPASPLASP